MKSRTMPSGASRATGPSRDCRRCQLRVVKRTREVRARARSNSHWSRPHPLSKSQIGELERLRSQDAEAFVEAVQSLHPKRVEQLQKELPPAELRQILQLQIVYDYQARAEEVASEIQDLIERKVDLDCDRVGFWFDLLSRDQIEILWKASNADTRRVILDSLMEETRDELRLDMADPVTPAQSKALLSSLHSKRLGLSALSARWKNRFGVNISSDPNDFTLMQGGKRGSRILPNARFSEYDVRRIKAVGPSLEDVVLQQWDLPAKSASGSAKKVDMDENERRKGEQRSSGERKTRDQEIEGFNVKRAYQDERFQFIHPEVVWDTRAFMKLPKWKRMKKMPYMEFYHGLRRRNPHSSFFDEAAEPWKVEMFLDGGQRWPRTAFGVRAVVTSAEGRQRWVDMPDPGAAINLVTEEGLDDSKEKSLMTDYGYLQIFEQLQEAYGAPGGKVTSPTEDLVNVSYYITPPVKDVVFVALQWRWFVLGAVVLSSFLGKFFYNLTMKTKAKDRRAGAFEDMNEAIDFGRSRADTRMEGKTGVALGQVAGIDYLRTELEEVIDLLKNPLKYQALRVRPPKGILLMGPPGVGKTLIAKAIAGEAGVPFYSLAGSEFTELIVGVGAARVRDLFKRARVNVPCLIFIDEIEALGHKREMNESESKNEERDQALNQLLTEMDGFTPDTGIVVMAATNAPHLIDEALLRPGRFDRKVSVRKPNQEARRSILEVHAQKHPIGARVDLNQLANDTPGLSGAELEKILNEAALEAIRRQEPTIDKGAVYYALDRVLEGSSLPMLPDSYDCNKIFAYHEAGVGLISELLRRENASLQAVKALSLVPRNRSWSRTTYFISSDKSYKMLTQEDMKRQIQVQLAGRAAEEVAFGEATTYSALNVARASDVAVKMLNSGLAGDEILPFTFPADFFTKGIVFSDPQVIVQRQELLDITTNMATNDPNGLCPPSDITRLRAECAVRDLLEEAHARNLDILRENRAALDAISARLLESKEVDGDELADIIDAASLPTAGA